VADDNDFTERLRQARAKRGMDAAPSPKGQLPSGAGWGVGFRAGVEIVSALVVGIVLGGFLDRWLGTWPWLFLVGFVLGSAAGILNVYRLFDPKRRPPLQRPGRDTGLD
jgi:ATP synthase protein I